MPSRSRIADQGLLEAALLLVFGFAAVSSCVIGVRALTEARLTVEAVVLTEPPAVDGASSGRFEVQRPTETVLSVTDPTWGERMLAASGWLVLAAVVGIAGLLLWRVLTGLKSRDPFDPANLRRLTVAAVLVTAGGLASGVLRAVSELDLTLSAETAFRDIGSSPVVNGGQLALTPILVGLVLIYIALVYRRGAALRHDLEGLV